MDTNKSSYKTYDDLPLMLSISAGRNEGTGYQPSRSLRLGTQQGVPIHEDREPDRHPKG